ncbi:MAG: nucleoside phosphorylase [Acidimicrobiales bacterium]|nr:nucleoside phosphorylase [Acidimicrobiales bacterium]
MSATNGRRILVLAPMPIELAPVKKLLGLTKGTDGTLRGTVAGTDVVAALAGIGPKPSADAARRLIDAHAPDHVVVVGVAGGLGATISIGDLVVPAEVTDLDTGRSFEATALGRTVPAGRLVTSAELIVDRAVLDGHAGDGIDAIDMETSAVAAVCLEQDLPWTAFRGISDQYTEELVDRDTMGLMRADGSPDLGAVARYVVRRPANVAKLARMGRGTRSATQAATRALLAAIRADAAA